MRSGIITILSALLIGLSVGGTSAWYLIRNNHGVGAINAGVWTAWPFAGGADTDPYTMARAARDGTIPLGVTEGLAFEADEDSRGRPLNLSCDYRIAGLTPPARLWTLAIYRPGGELIRDRDGKVAATHSGKLLRFADGSFRIQISSRPRPGNWLPVAGTGRFYFVLRVYDTPVTSTSGLATPRMPEIVREDCRS